MRHMRHTRHMQERNRGSMPEGLEEILEEIIGCILAAIILPIQYLWVVAWLIFIGAIFFCFFSALIQVTLEKI